MGFQVAAHRQQHQQQHQQHQQQQQQQQPHNAMTHAVAPRTDKGVDVPDDHHTALTAKSRQWHSDLHLNDPRPKAGRAHDNGTTHAVAAPRPEKCVDVYDDDRHAAALTARSRQWHSDRHLNDPRPNAGRAHNTDAALQSRWQAASTDYYSKPTRRRGGSEETHNKRHQHRNKHCRPADDHSVPSSLGLALAPVGRVTERGHARYRRRRDGEEDASRDTARAPDSLDTTRSEPGGGGGARRLSRVTSTRRGPQPLDELLDYFWVYQGMGRQVLNLDVAGRGGGGGGGDTAWDRTLFGKKPPAKLPPVSLQSTAGQTATAAASPPSVAGGRGCSRADRDESVGGPDSSGASEERRTVSEPAYAIGHGSGEPPGGCWSLASRSERDSAEQSERESAPPAAARDSGCAADFEVVAGGVSLESRTRTQIVGGRQGKVRLVVKMPVLTQEMSCADLLEKD